MRLITTLFSLVLLAASALGQAVDYRSLRQDQFTTNLPSRGYVGIKGSGVTNIPGTNVNISAGGSIIFTTNGQNISISTTGTGQATNVALIAGQDIGIATNGAGTWTINTTNFWGTNAVDGTITNRNAYLGVTIHGNTIVTNLTDASVQVTSSNASIWLIKAVADTNSTSKAFTYTDAKGEHFVVTRTGNLSKILDVSYNWPAALGSLGSILTDTDGAGTLAWNQPLNSGVVTNFATTNTSTGLTNAIQSIATNVANNAFSNQVPNFIHGTTNQIAKFTPNTNTVGDSMYQEVATNMWEARSRSFGTAVTNAAGMTNRMTPEWTSVNNWSAFDIVASSANGTGINEIHPVHGSGFTQGDGYLKLMDTWLVEPLTPLSGHTAGNLYPDVDSTASTIGYTVGSSSKRVKQFVAGAGGFRASQNDVAPNYASDTYGIMAGSASLQFWKNSDGGYAAIQRDGNSVTGLTVGPRVVGFGATLLGWDTFLQRGNEAFTFSFGTNNSGTSPQMPTLTGAEGSGTDKAGSDVRLAGSRGTGNGPPGNLYFATPRTNGGSGSSIQTLVNRMSIDTNGAVTIYSNLTVNGTGGANFVDSLNVSSNLWVTNGYLGLGTTAEFRMTNNAGTTGQALLSAGAGKSPYWGAAGGAGTVTSVGITGPAGVTWANSPVTTSGTLTATTPGILVTNGEDQAIVFSNSPSVDFTHQFNGSGAGLTNVWIVTPMDVSIGGATPNGGSRYVPFRGYTTAFGASAANFTFLCPAGGYFSNVVWGWSAQMATTTNATIVLQTNVPSNLTTVDTALTSTLQGATGVLTTNSGTTSYICPAAATIVNWRYTSTAALPAGSLWLKWEYWHQSP